MLKSHLTLIVVYYGLAIGGASYSTAHGQGYEIKFTEDFEAMPRVWSTSNGVWEIGMPTSGPDSAYTGANCAGTVLGGLYSPNSDSRLISSKIVLPSLGEGEELQLRFWHWFVFSSGAEGFVQISVDDSSWQTIPNRTFRGSSPVWTQSIIDLSTYADSTIRVAFRFTSGSFYQSYGWFIDDISILGGRFSFPNLGSESFEMGIGDWSADNGLWEAGVPTSGPNSAYSGQNCAGIVLGGLYPSNSDSRLISPKIVLPSLGEGEELQLRFWHWFVFSSGAEGFVQISVDDSSWQTIPNRTFRGSSPVWTQSIIDLSTYADSTIRVAFRFTSGSFYQSYGWFIDDISILGGRFSFPNLGSESFEMGIGDWSADNGMWEAGVPTSGPDSAYTGANCAGTVLGGLYSPNSDSRLISPKIVLPSLGEGEELQLRFWHWFVFSSGAEGVVQISVDDSSWQTIPNRTFRGSSPVWTQSIIDLSTYADSTIRVAFRFTSGSFYQSFGWFIDDVEITGLTPLIIQHNSVTVVDASSPVNIKAMVTGYNIADVVLDYRQGGEPIFSITVLSAQGMNQFLGVIPGILVTSKGLEYRIMANDINGRQIRAPADGYYSIRVRVADGVRKTRAQPSANEQSAYRLVSIPIDLDDKSVDSVLFDNLGNYDTRKWRLFELSADQAYSEFPKTSDLAVGKGFWLIIREPDKIIDSGSGISNITSREFAIPLHPKWNLIGTPFNFPIPASHIRLASGEPCHLRSYTGVWNDPIDNPIQTILPFEGYAISNSLSRSDTLFVNPDLSTRPSQLAKIIAKESKAAINWSIQILSNCQHARDIDNIAATTAHASTGKDDFDQPEPPVIGEYVSVYFPHREWNTLAKTYCVDARPEPAEGEVWEFEVKTNIRDKVHLAFEGIESVPPEFEVWLMDDALRITQNLRESNSYTVAGSEQPKSLKLVVGKKDFIENKLTQAALIPTRYELSQNFPNPFNPVTTIRYGLPQAGRVSLKIYNLLGEEVATLVDDEHRAAGYHTAIWDGRDKNGGHVASGVYMYRIHAGNFAMTKKMAMVK